MKVYLYSILILVLFSNCSSVKVSYGNNCIPVVENHRKDVLKRYDAEKENYSILYFTESFKDDDFVISNDNGVLYSRIISTVEGVGLAYVIRIDNNLDTKIDNKREGFSFVIKKDKYKFIYLRKTKSKKYDIVYSDTLCGFR